MSGGRGFPLRLSANVVWTKTGDVVYVANAAGAHPFVLRALEGTAATIWEMLQDGPTEQALFSRIAKAYGVDPEAVIPEVRQFLADLRVGNLLAHDG
ncbi:PqqD family protein [Microbacterium enclense]|uniref:PqqD family protein n=1 Tax=Microbacterium enclense TaxID=993073 RepID=UPI0021A26573|nr:PqqD family protein [Microbacterium enclense]MCT2085769.1 PqqD family protein [Microbacterium enclense]